MLSDKPYRMLFSSALNFRARRIRTLADYDQGRENNYNLIRFMAATLVIFSHSYGLLGIKRDPLAEATHYISFGYLAVYIFFIVSGFLVTKSFLSRGDLLSYIEARIFRIYPALILSVIFTALVVGIWATVIPLTAYVTDPQTIAFLIHNMSLIRVDHYLPGVFADNPFPGAVNGSLWTLPAEIRLYILVAFLGILGVLSRRWVFNGVTAGTICLYFFFPKLFLSYAGHPRYLPLVAFFVAGVFCYINRDRIPLFFSILAGLTAASFILHGSRFFPMVFSLALIYGVFWFAYGFSGWILNFNRMGDYSYGLYIYAFPVQQSVVFLNPDIDPSPLFISTFALTLPLAVFSWNFVEKPSLKLKGKVSGKLRSVLGLGNGDLFGTDAPHKNRVKP